MTPAAVPAQSSDRGPEGTKKTALRSRPFPAPENKTAAPKARRNGGGRWIHPQGGTSGEALARIHRPETTALPEEGPQGISLDESCSALAGSSPGHRRWVGGLGLVLTEGGGSTNDGATAERGATWVDGSGAAGEVVMSASMARRGPF